MVLIFNGGDWDSQRPPTHISGTACQDGTLVGDDLMMGGILQFKERVSGIQAGRKRMGEIEVQRFQFGYKKVSADIVVVRRKLDKEKEELQKLNGRREKNV